MNFLGHYNNELRHLRETGARFAKEHPQVAGQLGLHENAVTDPFVERLLEGVAYLAARVHTRLDRECAEFAAQALAATAPLYATATPSITSFALHPDFASPETFRNRCLPRGTVISAFMPGRAQAVQMVTGSDVQLWPLHLRQAECARHFNDLPQRIGESAAQGLGVIRLRFELNGSSSLGELTREIEDAPLRLQLAGDLPIAYELLRVLLAETRAVWALVPQDHGDEAVALPLSALGLAGLSPDEALLPAKPGAMPGLRLLREYFAQPRRFLALELQCMERIARQAPNGRRFDLIFQLRNAPAALIGAIGPAQFRLFSSPAINLYPKRLDPVPYDQRRTAQWVVADRLRAQAHHLWSVEELHLACQDGSLIAARSALSASAFDERELPGRYTLRRDPPLLAEGSRQDHGGDPLASHDELTVSVPGQPGLLESVTTLLVKGLLADRGWRPAGLLDAELQLQNLSAAARIECLWAGSEPRPIPNLQSSWNAVACLGDNPLDQPHAGEIDITARVARLLALAANEDDALDRQRINSLRSVRLASSHVRAGRGSPMAWVPSQKLSIDVARAYHADQGAWLFARLVAQALAEATPLNQGLEVEILLDGELQSRHSNVDSPDGVLQ